MLKCYATLGGGAVKCNRLLDTKAYYALLQSVAYYATLYLKAYYATKECHSTVRDETVYFNVTAVHV